MSDKLIEIGELAIRVRKLTLAAEEHEEMAEACGYANDPTGSLHVSDSRDRARRATESLHDAIDALSCDKQSTQLCDMGGVPFGSGVSYLGNSLPGGNVSDPPDAIWPAVYGECQHCDGLGKLNEDPAVMCPVCEGSGIQLRCLVCSGMGTLTVKCDGIPHTAKCPDCDGTGMEPNTPAPEHQAEQDARRLAASIRDWKASKGLQRSGDLLDDALEAHEKRLHSQP